MEAVLHKANTRGFTNNEWLESWHTFSFGNYHDATRMQFGALRVLNDDTVAPGAGFGRHGHMNMEIISIPLYGDLEHEDSMGNHQVIREGDVQVMSAGTGITHSEKNKNNDQFVKFLQVWLYPNRQNVAPRYDQKTFDEKERQNKLVTIVSPMGEGEGLNIYQDAWISMGRLDKSVTLDYNLHKQGNGVYLFVLEGDIMADEFVMNRRDGLGLKNRNRLVLKADTDAEVLVLEVPMIT
jgi:redox-sensitive bicupin YhaK (pirin superfamily)